MKTRTICAIIVIVIAALTLLLIRLGRNPADHDSSDEAPNISQGDKEAVQSSGEKTPDPGVPEDPRALQEHRGGMIHGTVTDPDGIPIPGAGVAAAKTSEIESDLFFSWDDGVSAETDSDGYYRISPLDEGSYSLCASEAEHADSVETGISVGAVGSQGATRIVDFVLEKGLECSGVVMDRNDQHIEGAMVSARLPIIFEERDGVSSPRDPRDLLYNNAIAESAADGSFRLTCLKSREYDLTASKQGYSSTSFDINPPSSDLRIVLSLTSGFKGHVVNAVDGTPIDGFNIHLTYQKSAWTIWSML